MINKVPLVVSLKREQQTNVVETSGGDVSVSNQGQNQYSLIVRALYFVVFGWWVSFMWMAIAYLFTISVVGLPIAVVMYDRLPFIVSLYKY